MSGVQRFIKIHRNIEGIGVCVPGLVDPETGAALFIPHFKWRNWPLASELRRATDLPVTVDNDANAAALAVLWLGRPEIRDVRDFILVLVEEGLGTGIIFDGQVYQGVAERLASAAPASFRTQWESRIAGRCGDLLRCRRAGDAGWSMPGIIRSHRWPRC